MPMHLKERALLIKARCLEDRGMNICRSHELTHLLPDRCAANALRFLAIETIGELSQLLGSSKELMEQFIAEEDYHTFVIPKKKGGGRIIHAPPPQLKLLQRRLNYYLQAYYSLIAPLNVMGFTYNTKHPRNIQFNARAHAGRYEVLNIDLKDFFSTITARQIMQLFMGTHFQFSKHIAATLSLLCTYQGSLPMGAPSSPILTNFICWELDAALKSIADEEQLSYTRYADDISFSALKAIPDDVVLDIINAIHACSFTVNYKKVRRQYQHQRQTVTGLTVNQFPNVDRQLLKQVRAMIHDLELRGDWAVVRHFKLRRLPGNADVKRFLQKLKGQLQFIASVKGKDHPWVNKYQLQFEEALRKHHLEVWV